MKKQWKIVLGVAAFFIVLGIGAAVGGAVSYFYLRDNTPVAYAAFRDSDLVLNSDGIIVSSVNQGSAADQAGLVRGDILLAIDGQNVDTFNELQQVLQDYSPGDSAVLTVLHGDETLTLTAVLDDLDSTAFLGISTCMETQNMGVMIKRGPIELEKHLEIITQPGAKITDVVVGSPADEAGIMAGDMILNVGGVDIDSETSLADLIRKYSPGDRVELKISRGGDDMNVQATLGENPEVSGQAYLGVAFQFPIPNMSFEFDGEEHFFEMPHHEFGEEGRLPFFHHEMPGLGQLPEGVENAVIIGEVIVDSPAEEAGLLTNDLIIKFNGEPVKNIDAFVDKVASFSPGESIFLTVLRDGEEFEVELTLTEHPDNSTKGFLGVMVKGFIKIKIEGGLPEQFNFDLDKEFNFPGGDT